MQNSTAGKPDESPVRDGFVQRFFGVLTSPRASFENIAAHPTWLAPLLVILVVSLISFYFIGDIIIQGGLEQSGQLEQMSADDVANALKYGKWFAIVTMLVSIPLTYVVIAGILLFVGNVIMGGESSFKAMLAVSAWAGIVTVIAAVINVPFIMQKGVFQSATSLVFLADDPKSLMYFLFSQIDLFTIWTTILYGIGLAAANGWESSKGITVTLGLWVFYLVVMLGIKAITA